MNDIKKLRIRKEIMTPMSKLAKELIDILDKTGKKFYPNGLNKKEFKEFKKLFNECWHECLRKAIVKQ